jgi:hypothetical protein
MFLFNDPCKAVAIFSLFITCVVTHNMSVLQNSLNCFLAHCSDFWTRLSKTIALLILASRRLYFKTGLANFNKQDEHNFLKESPEGRTCVYIHYVESEGLN